MKFSKFIENLDSDKTNKGFHFEPSSSSTNIPIIKPQKPKSSIPDEVYIPKDIVGGILHRIERLERKTAHLKDVPKFSDEDIHSF